MFKSSHASFNNDVTLFFLKIGIPNFKVTTEVKVIYR